MTNISGIDLFIRSVKDICPELTVANLDQFASRVSIQELNKKGMFIQADKVQKVIGFITQGIVRSFFIDQEGNEITVGFYREGEYATHYPAFITRQPSRYSIQCLEATSFVCLSWEDIQWMYQQFPQFERYGRLIAEEVLKTQQARIESFLFETAEERYTSFIDRHPDLFSRISLSHLCSYLGIERQTLTRIRQKLTHK